MKGDLSKLTVKCVRGMSAMSMWADNSGGESRCLKVVPVLGLQLRYMDVEFDAIADGANWSYRDDMVRWTQGDPFGNSLMAIW